MKAILWILLFIFLAVWAAYPFVFHCSYGWDVEQMRIACKAEGEPEAVGTVSPTPRPRWEVRDAPLDWESKAIKCAEVDGERVCEGDIEAEVSGGGIMIPPGGTYTLVLTRPDPGTVNTITVDLDSLTENEDEGPSIDWLQTVVDDVPVIDVSSSDAITSVSVDFPDCEKKAEEITKSMVKAGAVPEDVSFACWPMSAIECECSMRFEDAPED